MQIQPSGISSKMYVVRLSSTPLDTDRTQEKRRQKHFINLIPSENFTSQAVLDALGSVMQSGFQS
jgi:glycine/serine hydroxymethyltransferase